MRLKILGTAALAFLSFGSPAYSQTTGFIYNNGTYTTLSDPLAIGPTSAYGISDAGQVVGSYFNATSEQGFIYSNGNYSTLSFPGSTATVLYGINNSGQIVGNYLPSGGGGVMQGFLYSNGTFTTLADPVSPFVTQAQGISNGGQVTGNINLSSTGYGYVYNNGSFTTITPPTGSTCIGCGITANGINNAGQVVGVTGGLYPSYTLVGFVYANGTYNFLNFPSATVMPYGINDTSQIVGQLLLSDNTSPGFLYSNGAFTILSDPLSPTGDTRAYGINNSGQIVGDYDAGGSGGVVGAVPEPSTWVMMLIGFAGIGFLSLRNPKQFCLVG